MITFFQLYPGFRYNCHTKLINIKYPKLQLNTKLMNIKHPKLINIKYPKLQLNTKLMNIKYPKITIKHKINKY